MTIEQKRRELFEAIFHVPAGVKFSGPYYMGGVNATGLTIINIQWHAFNAALDAVVIDLPPELIDWDEVGMVRNSTLKKCRAAIESTGLGLKVKS